MSPMLPRLLPFPRAVLGCGLLGALLAAGPAAGAPSPCAQCEEWNQPQAPFRIFGNTYYVGVRGLSAILITGDAGHILIDGGIAESAPQIAAHIRALGFRVEDVKLLLNSHVHFDHAGGLAALQRMSGAAVAASAPAAAVLRSGQLGPDDPQHGSVRALAPLARVRVVQDGESVRVGPLALQAHLTPGHTPGGTSWTWRACEGERCVNVVYADSLSAVSAPGYHFSQHPEVVQSFEHSFRVLEQLPCEVLLTPHPGFSDLQHWLEQPPPEGRSAAAVNPQSCRDYARQARLSLAQRLKSEARPRP